jgi:hypothetical protein
MRTFLNVTKKENKRLSDKFSFLLKYNDDCTTEDFSWAAITIFDHWLYESNSFDVIEQASDAQKCSWDDKIKDFLRSLVKIETPIRYRYLGRNTNQRLQFSRYIKDQNFDDYVANLFDELYTPNIVFDVLGVDLWFEDNWTLHIKYKRQENCLKLFELVADSDMFILPAYSAGHLNDYRKLSAYLDEQGLGKCLEVSARIEK